MSTDSKSLSEKLSDFYDTNIIKAAHNAFDTNVVNIISDYPWALNCFDLKGKLKYPHAFVREFRQNMSVSASTISYLANSLGSAVFGKSISELFGLNSSSTKNLSREDKEANQRIASAKARTTISKAEDLRKNTTNIDYGGPLDRFTGNMADILSPYKYMYSVSNENCLKYIFPIFKTEYGISNSYADSPQFSNRIIYSAMQHIGDAGNLASLIGSGTDLGKLLDQDFGWNDQGIYIEKPKYFQVDTQGDSVTISFPLYNTIRKGNQTDLWKKNYEFIKFFALKNLPFKISAFRFKTPALYEVNIPGDKYMPFSYVSKFSASSAGVAKYLTYKENEADVLVPEAWLISITFTSLLFKSANLSYTAFNSVVETGEYTK